jgi:hypothetical protein
MTSGHEPGEPAVQSLLAEDAAPHVGPAFADVRSASRAAVNPRGPHHLAHFSGSVYDFEVDIIDGCPPEVAASPVRLRADCRRTGRLLSAAIDDLDDDLRAAATGALIRVVLHAEEGAFCCDSIVPGRHVVGVVFDRAHDQVLSAQPLVRSCDEVISVLATEQRRLLSLGTQNPGGFGTPAAPVRADHTTRTEKVHIAREPATDISAGALAEVEAACVNAVGPADLHYVALHTNRTVALLVDCMDHDDVSRFFTQISVSDRRAFYRRFGHDLPHVVGRFTRMTAPVIGARLLRMVLDVEQGALCYYRLAHDSYLVGATLNQARVATADDKVAALAVVCREVLAGKRK